jgi:hypothetical protein
MPAAPRGWQGTQATVVPLEAVDVGCPNPNAHESPAGRRPSEVDPLVVGRNVAGRDAGKSRSLRSYTGQRDARRDFNQLRDHVPSTSDGRARVAQRAAEFEQFLASSGSGNRY